MGELILKLCHTHATKNSSSLRKAETSEISALTENKNLEVPKQESKKSAKDWGRASNDPRNKG